MDAIKKPSKEQEEESSGYPYRQQSYSLRSQPSQSGFEPPEQSSPPPPPPYYHSSSQQPVDPMKYLPEDVEEMWNIFFISSIIGRRTDQAGVKLLVDIINSSKIYTSGDVQICSKRVQT